MDVRVSREEWIEEAMAILADAGIDGVKVEPLARRLRVTKGGFYWHFKDRQDLLTAMLDVWCDGRVEAIRRQARDAGKDARDRLAGLIRLYVANRNPKGAAIELAVRDWARRDPQVATAVARVDSTRLDLVAALFGELGLDESAARARAFLMYSYLFGQALLVLDPADRERLAEDCARTLLP